MSEVPKFALGTPVSYTHRAAVARYHTETARGWRLHEGVSASEGPPWGELITTEKLADAFASWPQAAHGKQKINKTIMVWPEDGSGVVIAYVKRGRGVSVSGSFSPSNPYSEGEYDQGYFEADDYFMLYAVKRRLQGLDYIFVPPWAIKTQRWS